jgi:hypothetical protein
MRLIVALAIVAAHLGTAEAKRTAEIAGDWSPSVHNLRGRLLATPRRDHGHAQLSLVLELENLGEVPLTLVWGDPGEMIQLALEDDAGSAIPSDHPGGNSLQGPPRRVQLQPHKKLRTVLSKGVYEYLALDRVMLRPFTFQGWFLSQSGMKVSLRGELTAKEGGADVWAGTLRLPAVHLTTP